MRMARKHKKQIILIVTSNNWAISEDPSLCRTHKFYVYISNYSVEASEMLSAKSIWGVAAK